jgi:hypothetical protein
MSWGSEMNIGILVNFCPFILIYNTRNPEKPLLKNPENIGS